MPFSNYIYEYYDGVSSGNITVGKWVRLLYEYIVKGLQEGLFTFNAKKANKAIRFIENFCHHCEGRTDLLKLELWQKAAVSVLRMWSPAYRVNNGRYVSLEEYLSEFERRVKAWKKS